VAKYQLSLALSKQAAAAAHERSVYAGMFNKFVRQDLLVRSAIRLLELIIYGRFLLFALLHAFTLCSQKCAPCSKYFAEGTSRATAEPREAFLGEKIFEFFFKMMHFSVLYIFERQRGPQTSCGLPYPPFSPCPPIDSIIKLMTVWRITGNIVRTAISLTYAQL